MSVLNDMQITLKDEEEYKKFRQYYINSRNLDIEAVKDAISILSENIEERARLFKIAKNELDKTLVSTFGEACVSYHLEEKLGIILTHAGWKASPFTISQGVDLIGGDISNLSNVLIVYVEVKTKRNFSYITSTLNDLKTQLTLNRIGLKFNRSSGDYSYIGIASRLIRHIREKKIIEQSKINIKKDYFERVGAVVMGKTYSFQKVITKARPTDCSLNRPCYLMLLILEGLENRFNELFSIETLVDKYTGEP